MTSCSLFIVFTFLLICLLHIDGVAQSSTLAQLAATHEEQRVDIMRQIDDLAHMQQQINEAVDGEVIGKQQVNDVKSSVSGDTGADLDLLHASLTRSLDSNSSIRRRLLSLEESLKSIQSRFAALHSRLTQAEAMSRQCSAQKEELVRALKDCRIQKAAMRIVMEAANKKATNTSVSGNGAIDMQQEEGDATNDVASSGTLEQQLNLQFGTHHHTASESAELLGAGLSHDHTPESSQPRQATPHSNANTETHPTRQMQEQQGHHHQQQQQSELREQEQTSIDSSPHPVAPSPTTLTFLQDQPLHAQPGHDHPSREIRRHKLRQVQMPPFPSEYLDVDADSHSHSEGHATDAEAKRREIRDEFLHAWNGYKASAWGFDELHPLSRTGRNSQYYMALTMIDALDTLILMGFADDVTQVRNYLRDHLTFDGQEDINVFETTIRVIGGLLSAHALTGDQLYVELAEECAQGLLVAFDTNTGIPLGTVGLRSKVASNPEWSSGSSTMAEVGSIQLEWSYLSRLTRNPIYEQKVERVMQHLASLNRALYPQFINVDTGLCTSQTITFGARVDSLYEYFLKSYLMSGGRKEKSLSMYIESMRAMDEQLVKKSRGVSPEDPPLTFIAEFHGGKTLTGKQDHLVCFLPGTLALGVWSGSVSSTDAPRHMELARELMRTCYEMYASTATNLAPEIILFDLDPDASGRQNDPGFRVDPNAAHNLLRPETVESLFIMWRITHDEVYREWGWKIFKAFQKWTKLPDGGYAGLKDVRKNNREEEEEADGKRWSNHGDKMESFFLSETLKYLYLLFSPDTVLPLDRWVFNTEAHPFPIQMDEIMWETEEERLRRRMTPMENPAHDIADDRAAANLPQQSGQDSIPPSAVLTQPELDEGRLAAEATLRAMNEKKRTHAAHRVESESDASASTQSTSAGHVMSTAEAEVVES